MVIDYFKITPLEPKSKLATNSFAIDSKSQISVFPNPALNEIKVTTTSTKKIIKIEVLNTISKSILKTNYSKQKINISKYPKGVYFLKISLNDGSFVMKKFLKS